jgi:hypothetical protein
MLPSNQATRRLARDLVAHYGDDAVLAASERAEAMVKIGNADAAEIWTAVIDLIRRMRIGDRHYDA